MKVMGTMPTTGAFTVKERNGEAIITFYENATMVAGSSEEGGNAEWQWDEYTIRRPYYANLGTDIEANYDVWLQAAKAEEEARTPVDAWQLRADVDFLQITQTAAMGIAVMSVGSDPTVLEKARQYYPKRWTKEQLQMLVQIQKLSAEDYQALTGEALSA